MAGVCIRGAGIGFGLAVGSWIIAFGYSGAIFLVIVLILCIMMNLDKYIKQIQADLEAKAAAERNG